LTGSGQEHPEVQGGVRKRTHVVRQAEGEPQLCSFTSWRRERGERELEPSPGRKPQEHATVSHVVAGRHLIWPRLIRYARETQAPFENRAMAIVPALKRGPVSGERAPVERRRVRRWELRVAPTHSRMDTINMQSAHASSPLPADDTARAVSGISPLPSRNARRKRCAIHRQDLVPLHSDPRLGALFRSSRTWRT
jgi:hypothetical protein